MHYTALREIDKVIDLDGAEIESSSSLMMIIHLEQTFFFGRIVVEIRKTVKMKLDLKMSFFTLYLHPCR